MDIPKLSQEFQQRIATVKTQAELDEVRNDYLGRKRGVITALLKELPSLPTEQRATAGKEINQLKKYVEETIDLKSAELTRPQTETQIDWSLPGKEVRIGAVHPLTKARRMVEDIFREMGYAVAEGPEIETDFNNFAALNFPPDHPARDTQDTLFVETPPNSEPLMLRTHTSPVQIRTMLQTQPPVRILCPGRVYRKDEIDATHSPIFHQMEGLAVDDRITFADLKGTLHHFAKRLFDQDVKVQFRPSFFPFTEPSAEMDCSCVNCKGKGCSMCKQTGWLEILGSGMVHPNVLEAVGYDSEKYTGFAFGMGIERIAILFYGIPDIRLLYNNDLRFLSQFRVVT
ncbi:MAG TPA: phenylalanine--tRNA ligase subunit alpha [Acidobacteriota bacterium]|nr:phenylalanine--tRNA ligase subunit alpha [Acidobacteriota bacterium]